MKPASRLIALMTLALIHAASRQAFPDSYKLPGHKVLHSKTIGQEASITRALRNLLRQGGR